MKRSEALSEPRGFPLRTGNRLDILVNGVEIFPAMLEAIRAARSTICLETYIYWNGQIGEALSQTLAAQAAAGRDVRVVLDWWGCFKLDRSVVQQMKRAGVKVRYFRPLIWWRLRRFNHRSHRRILIVDGRIGFIGGVGIGDVWSGDAQNKEHWRDNHYRVAGPVVADLQRVFFSHWDPNDLPADEDAGFFPLTPPDGDTGVQVIAAEPAIGCRRIRDEFLLALCRARRKLGIVTPYFLPGPRLLAALHAARDRDVEVEVITCGRNIDHDIVRCASRHHWGSLLANRIRIYEFEPTLIHAKSILIDDREVIVGSANFDCRSSRINGEANLRIESPAVAARHWELFEKDRRQSTEVELSTWRRRGILMKFGDAVSHLLSSQM
jgi:cardiolipin synthase